MRKHDVLDAERYVILDDALSQKIATMNRAVISTNSIRSVHEELIDGSLLDILSDWSLVDQTALWLVYLKSNVPSAKVRVLMDFFLSKSMAGLLGKRLSAVHGNARLSLRQILYRQNKFSDFKPASEHDQRFLNVERVGWTCMSIKGH